MAGTITLHIPGKGMASGKAAPRMEAKGFPGMGCTEKTKFLERALGSTKTQELTDEAFVEDAVTNLEEKIGGDE